MNSILILLLAWIQLASAESELCPHVILKDGHLKLARNEKVLICGSQESDAWHEVPLPQAQYELNTILQNKGFLNARFERAGDRLNVWAGPLKRTEHLIVTGANGLIQPGKKRKVIGHALDPAKLDEVTAWAELALRRKGYACPKVETSAQVWNATMSAAVEPGQKGVIAAVERTGLEGLNPAAMRRFEAFSAGDAYDVVETQITVSRLLSQGLFQSAYFTTRCTDDKVNLHLFTGIGKSRLVRFGLGASTEEFPFADVWFKNARLDDRASNFTASIHGSNIRQSFTAGSELYVVPGSQRSYLGPRFLLEHRKERAYETNKLEVGADLGRDFDLAKIRLQGRAGPTLNYEKVLRGAGPPDAKYLSWQGSVAAMSHAYEAFTRDQFEGWTGLFRYKGQRKGIGSQVNVDRYGLEFKHLWNVGHFSPPLFVFATRIEAVAVDSKQLTAVDAQHTLPLDYRVFFGGDENLRGFARESLNNHGLGYLTALHGGFEVRLIEELPWHLEPFLLWDYARLGDRRYTLNKPVYSSSGFGLRWASPFGTLRASAARGRIWGGDPTTVGYRQEWVYFLSFGQEF